MVRHDYEIVQLESMFGHKRAQDVNEKMGIALGLQQAAGHARLRGREKNP